MICCSAWSSPLTPPGRPRRAPGDRAGPFRCSSPCPGPGLAPRLPSPLARHPVALIAARSSGRPPSVPGPFLRAPVTLTVTQPSPRALTKAPRLTAPAKGHRCPLSGPRLWTAYPPRPRADAPPRRAEPGRRAGPGHPLLRPRGGPRGVRGRGGGPERRGPARGVLPGAGPRGLSAEPGARVAIDPRAHPRPPIRSGGRSPAGRSPHRDGSW